MTRSSRRRRAAAACRRLWRVTDAVGRARRTQPGPARAAPQRRRGACAAASSTSWCEHRPMADRCRARSEPSHHSRRRQSRAQSLPRLRLHRLRESEDRRRLGVPLGRAHPAVPPRHRSARRLLDPAGGLSRARTKRRRAGAAREAWEEARAEIAIDGLLAVYDIPRISQVQLIYRARLDLARDRGGTGKPRGAALRMGRDPVAGPRLSRRSPGRSSIIATASRAAISTTRHNPA